jgi:hypothetical protein
MLRSAILKKLFIGLHVNQMRVSTAISCRRLTEDGPGQIGRCVDGMRSRLMARETFVGICDCSRGAHAFVGRVDGCKLGSQAVRKTLDRSISRAERMALVLRISRFIGTAMKPRRARLACTLSSYLCAGLCIFRRCHAMLNAHKPNVPRARRESNNALYGSSPRTSVLRTANSAFPSSTSASARRAMAPTRSRYLQPARVLFSGVAM